MHSLIIRIFISFLISSLALFSVPAIANVSSVMSAYQNLLSYKEVKDNTQQALVDAEEIVNNLPDPDSLPTCEYLQCEDNDNYGMPVFTVYYCPIGTSCPNINPYINPNEEVCLGLYCEPSIGNLFFECSICDIVHLVNAAELDLINAQNANAIAFADLLVAQSIYNSYADVYDDSDEDTIYDVIDNCPAIKNENQLDLNNTGVGDFCESVSIPAMGGIGLLALGLSMLGLGAVRVRRK